MSLSGDPQKTVSCIHKFPNIMLVTISSVSQLLNPPHIVYNSSTIDDILINLTQCST